jgi:hypothetical protein
MVRSNGKMVERRNGGTVAAERRQNDKPEARSQRPEARIKDINRNKVEICRYKLFIAKSA